MTMNGKDITFDVNGQSSAGYLAVPAQTNAPGVLVLHAWWGLNNTIKEVCDRLAGEGFIALAPDFYDGKIAKTIDEAKQLMLERDFARQQAIVAAAPDFLRSRPEVRKEPLSLIGFSMGASWSLVLSSERPEDIRKMVLFYGAGEADATKIRADVLGHFASMDEYEEPEYIRAMEVDLRAAGLKVTFHVYSNTKHWFFEEDRPEYNPEAAGVAWARTLEFLRG
jgi:carboxymethylenebutenolidase